MKEIKQYIVGAFTDKVFSGNQAAVCLPDEVLSPELMQKIAVENNFSETAFAVKSDDGYDLRWFTPGGEIDLCGHATLATAFIIMTNISPEINKLDFHTKSGVLTVVRSGDSFTMDFPQSEYKRIEATQDMADAIGVMPKEAYLGRDLMMVLSSEEDVINLNPKMGKVEKLPGLLQTVTAESHLYDCVTRTFAPKLKVTEDPVCGSTHCMVAPYWASRLRKENIIAYQASKRGGTLLCNILKNGRIDIGGNCVLFAKSTILLPDN